MEKIFLDRPDYYVGIGETGIDLYWDQTHISEQRDAFARQIHWGMEHQKPVIIHVRNSFDEVFDVLQNEIDHRFFGILHCFTGGKRHMVKALDLNLHLGIGGIVTFDQGLPNTVRKTPIERIVLETDSPYLSPAPHRGSRNETSYMIHVAEKVAEIFGKTVEEIADITTQNANQLFRENE
jgi:TatD DNase family protein